MIQCRPADGINTDTNYTADNDISSHPGSALAADAGVYFDNLGLIAGRRCGHREFLLARKVDDT